MKFQSHNSEEIKNSTLSRIKKNPDNPENIHKNVNFVKYLKCPPHDPEKIRKIFFF